MRVHPKLFKIQQLEAELSLEISKFIAVHEDLTEAEVLQILNNVLHSKVANVLKYMIRAERHGNTETPGDEAGEDQG
jgi:hypothetical protein